MTKVFENEKISVIQQNEYKGKMKEIYVVIHEDKDGNQGLFAEQCLRFSGRVGGAAEVSPYKHELLGMQEYVDSLNELVGGKIDKIKIKKFIAVEEPNE